MNKYMILSLISISLLVGCYSKKQTDAENSYRVAILTPVTHAALEEIIAGFKETLSKNIPCTFTIYNAHGDRVLLRNQAEMIIKDSYDLALAVATQPSIIMKEVASQRASELPIVCAAVDDPVKNGLVASLASSGNTITAVTESLDKNHYHKQLDHLLNLFPSIKKLLLIYSPNVMLDREKDLLASCCTERGITLSLLPIYACHELAQKAGIIMPGHDCVIILKDNTIVSCIETLVNLTNRMHLPLYASDLNSLAAGATCAYGVYEYEFGVQAAHQAYAILHDKKKPTDVASTKVDTCLFKINEKALQALGIPYKEQQ